MSARFVTRFLPALVLGAVALAVPVGAQDRYDSEYEHYRRDRHEARDHRSDDRHESLGHVIGDLFRYGTTDRYSSPDHYYWDQRRDYEHYFRDQDRTWDHYRRDRWDSYRNDDYYRNDYYNRSNDYYRSDDYGYSRDGRDRRR